jgi:hypothetical protein
MQYKGFFLTTALALVFTHTSFGQGPVGDEVMVTFDQTVQVGSHSLPAGKYTIRQITSASNPRVLEFTSNYGTNLHATVAAVPILQNTPTSKTRVILDNEGGTLRLARIWVQGKTYGYEFPGRSNSSAASNTVGLEGTFVAQAAPPAAVAEERAPAPAPTPAPVAQSTPPADNAVIAQNRPPADTPAPAAPQTQTTQAPSSQSADQPAASSDTAQNRTREVPATALGWMPLTLFGITLASAGAFLYRRERANR